MPEETATFDTPPSLAALGPRLTVYYVAMNGGAVIHGVFREDGTEVALTDEQREIVRGMVVAQYPAPTYADIRIGAPKDAGRVEHTRTRAVRYRGRGRHA